MSEQQPQLVRSLGLLGLVATGICAMMGAAINIIPIAVQRTVPEIGPWVLLAYAAAAVPALLAALAFAILGSAMPRAGGSYLYASRALHPYLGFVASFSQWFGLSTAIGVVSWMLVPFLRDVAAGLGQEGLAHGLEQSPIRLAIALGFLWLFVAVNILGLELYERTLVPLMFVMFAAAAVVIVTAFLYDQSDFLAAVLAQEGVSHIVPEAPPFSWSALIATSVILFSSFIGFDSIAQAGGEAQNPRRSLPLAIFLAVTIVGSFYLAFTAAMYYLVPWSFMAERSLETDLTAPGLLSYLLPAKLTVLITAGAAIALINDLPAMLLAVSRLVFAWSEDRIFPRFLARIHPRFHTPHRAIIASGAVATLSILGCALAGDFFLGVDILVTALIVTFLLMCLSVIALPHRNPQLAKEIRLLRSRPLQLLLCGGGALILTLYLAVHVQRDLAATHPYWFFHSTWSWLAVMGLASVVFFFYWQRLGATDPERDERFRNLPADALDVESPAR